MRMRMRMGLWVGRPPPSLPAGLPVLSGTALPCAWVHFLPPSHAAGAATGTALGCGGQPQHHGHIWRHHRSGSGPSSRVFHLGGLHGFSSCLPWFRVRDGESLLPAGTSIVPRRVP